MTKEMMYPKYLVRRPDDKTVLACTTDFVHAQRIKERLDREDIEYTLKEFGVRDGIKFEIFDVTLNRIVVEGNC